MPLIRIPHVQFWASYSPLYSLSSITAGQYYKYNYRNSTCQKPINKWYILVTFQIQQTMLCCIVSYIIMQLTTDASSPALICMWLWAEMVDYRALSTPPVWALRNDALLPWEQRLCEHSSCYRKNWGQCNNSFTTNPSSWMMPHSCPPLHGT